MRKLSWHLRWRLGSLQDGKDPTIAVYRILRVVVFVGPAMAFLASRAGSRQVPMINIWTGSRQAS